MKKYFLILSCTVFFVFGCQSNNSNIPNNTEQKNQPSQTEKNENNVNSNPILSAEDEKYKNEVLKVKVDACIKEKDAAKAFTCYEKHLKNQVAEKDPAAAFRDLKLLYNENNSIIRSFCHPFAHSIGHAGMDKYSTLEEAYQHGDPFCWSGYYHGVMEEMSERIGVENIPDQMNKICSGMPGKENYSFDYYNCVHGLGHGAMAINENELFDALKLCDRLEGSWEKESCFGGVFMENIIIDNRNLETKYLKEEDPLYPCNAVEKPYKEACYLMQTSYMLKVAKYDFQKVFDWCEKADEGFVVTCYRSLGRDASGSSVSNVERTHKTCMLGKNYEQQSECAVGAVKDFISYFHSDVEAKKLCNAFEDQKIIDYCLKTADEYYKAF